VISRVYAPLAVEDLRDAVESIPPGQVVEAARRDAG
jgi:hypothetical protein